MFAITSGLRGIEIGPGNFQEISEDVREVAVDQDQVQDQYK